MRLLDSLHKKKAYKLSGSSSRLYLIMRSKFILAFVVFVLIPFIVLGTIMQIKSSLLLLEQNNKQILAGLDKYLYNMEAFVSLASRSEDLISISEKITESSYPQKSEPEPKAISFLNDAASDMEDVRFNSVHILKANRVYTIYSKYTNPISREDIPDEKWAQEVVKKPDSVKITGTSMQFFGEGKSEYVISAAKALKNPYSGKITGILLIDFDYSALDETIKACDAFRFSGRELHFVKREGSGYSVMYSYASNLVTSPLDEDMQRIADSKSEGPRIYNVGGRGNLLVTSNTSKKAAWKIIYAFPVYKVIFDLIPYGSLWLIIVLICLIMILIFAVIIYFVILKPINKLTSVISEYEKGSFPSRMNLDKPDDELEPQMGALSGPSNIDNLINKVYYNQLKQKEAELNSLQNKINPHFLYNTLESIRGAALYNGIDSIASMAKSLSLLFRYSINNNVLVTVKEEVENLNNYITIQNFRHDDKFEVVYNIPEKVYQYKVLKLILQPIVENSIKHGLEMKLGKGLIKITILDLGSIIKIEISDDGTGMPPEKVIEINKLLVEGSLTNNFESGTHTGTGIGLQNVNSRIKLYFGEQYGIKFRESQAGAMLEIILPVVD